MQLICDRSMNFILHKLWSRPVLYAVALLATFGKIQFTVWAIRADLGIIIIINVRKMQIVELNRLKIVRCTYLFVN